MPCFADSGGTPDDQPTPRPLASGRRRGVGCEGATEVAAVLTAELRRALVPDGQADRTCVEVLDEHEAPGLLEADARAVLERGEHRHGLEVAVKRRGAHGAAAGELLNAHRLGVVLADPVGRGRHLVEVAVGGGDLAQQPAVLARQQPIVQLALDQRREHRGRPAARPAALRAVDQDVVKDADGDSGVVQPDRNPRTWLRDLLLLSPGSFATGARSTGFARKAGLVA